MKISSFYIVLICVALACNQPGAGNKHALDLRPNDTPHAKKQQVLIQNDTEKKIIALFDSIFVLPQEDGAAAHPKEEIYIDSLLKLFKNPSTFKLPFEHLSQKNVIIRTSDDQKLRAISWLSPYSGTMWYVQTIAQYDTSNDTMLVASLNRLFTPATETGTPTPFIDKVYFLPGPETPGYLLIGQGQMSGTEPYSTAHILQVAPNQFHVNDALFPKKELPFTTATVKGNDDAAAIRKQIAIQYDPVAMKLQVPQTRETSTGSVFSGRQQIYQFKKGAFVTMGRL
ncbi:MAG: hypothetical protein J7539_14835 [Niabella sp.]|nr:hypothetical protein [Niabella sp.]